MVEKEGLKMENHQKWPFQKRNGGSYLFIIAFKLMQNFAKTLE
jgi:hypothetical protein